MNLLAIAAAGFLGTITRAFLADLFTVGQVPGFPIQTLAVNFSGSFVLSFFMDLTLNRVAIDHRVRLAVCTGFLGAYTTFSTFAVESVGLLTTGAGWAGAAYITGTPLGCLIFAWLGGVSSRKIGHRRSGEESQ